MSNGRQILIDIMEIMQRYSNRSIDDEIYSCMIDDVKALILKHKDKDDEQRANET